MSKKTRFHVVAEGQKADREPIHLNPAGTLFSVVAQMLQGAINQATQADLTRASVSAYCEGRGLTGTWRLKVKGLNISEMLLVPVPDENEEPKPTEPKEPIEAGAKTS